jgi:hypothetical protein
VACHAEYSRRAEPPIGPTASNTAPRLVGCAEAIASTACSGASMVDEHGPADL